MINFKATKVYQDTSNALNELNEDGTTKNKIVIQEGSSRSSKTWSNFQCIFMMAYSNHFKSIVVLRDIATDCHDILEKEFIDWLSDPMARMTDVKAGRLSLREGLRLSDEENLTKFFIRNKQKHTWTCTKTNSVIRFTGLDSDTKVMGLSGDLVWINEPYNFNEEVFKQLLQRNKQILFDWNPREKHFIQDYKLRKDVVTLHSTFMDNPFCPEEARRQLLGYQPILFSEVVVKKLISEQEARIYDFEKNELKFTKKQLNEVLRCKYNEDTRSASAFHWQVYGLGIGAERPNRIFNWKTINYADYLTIEKPVWYGVDWGKVDPFGIVEAKYHDGKLYIHELNYKSENELIKSLTPTQLMQINQTHEEGLVMWLFKILNVDKSRPIICDNNRPMKVEALRSAGYENAVTADKQAGSIIDGIDLLSKLDVYYTTSSKNIQYEQENYSYKLDRKGNMVSPAEPEDKDNHCIDPVRYIVNKMHKLGIIPTI